MGCRICVIQAASTETMPLDLSMLLSNDSSHFDDMATSGGVRVSSGSVPNGGMPNGGIGVLYETCIDEQNPFSCRRVATFPTANAPHMNLASSLTSRSYSDTSALYRNATISCLTLSDLKRELSHLIEDDKSQSSLENGERPQSPDNNSGSSLLKHHHRNKDGRRSATKSRKRVMFADEKGLQLTTVKVMTEPSDVPPKLTSPVIRMILGHLGDWDGDEKPVSSWLLDFSQPASDYCRFRQTIERQNVALENVVLRNDQCKMVGTIKVKNLAFEKSVFIRFTDNCWQSYFDRPAVYQPSRRTGADVYDTFNFDVDIPADDISRDSIDFCVCYRTNGAEYWDSNETENFKIISESLKRLRDQQQACSPTVAYSNGGDAKGDRTQAADYPLFNDALLLDCQQWTNFASWRNLETKGPYY